MKLSEAIRLGAMLRPKQAFGVLYDDKAGATCALGAAGEAIGILDTTRWNSWKDGAAEKARPFWQWAARPGQPCPICGSEFDMSDYPAWCARTDAQAVIVHLNNAHRWTRERIADWVATVEPAAEPQPQFEAPALITA